MLVILLLATALESKPQKSTSDHLESSGLGVPDWNDWTRPTHSRNATIDPDPVIVGIVPMGDETFAYGALYTSDGRLLPLLGHLNSSESRMVNLIEDDPWPVFGEVLDAIRVGGSVVFVLEELHDGFYTSSNRTIHLVTFSAGEFQILESVGVSGEGLMFIHLKLRAHGDGERFYYGIRMASPGWLIPEAGASQYSPGDGTEYWEVWNRKDSTGWEKSSEHIAKNANGMYVDDENCLVFIRRDSLIDPEIPEIPGCNQMMSEWTMTGIGPINQREGLLTSNGWMTFPSHSHRTEWAPSTRWTHGAEENSLKALTEEGTRIEFVSDEINITTDMMVLNLPSPSAEENPLILIGIRSIRENWEWRLELSFAWILADFQLNSFAQDTAQLRIQGVFNTTGAIRPYVNEESQSCLRVLGYSFLPTPGTYLDQQEFQVIDHCFPALMENDDRM